MSAIVWLTQKEAIEHTKLSENTLVRWIKQGYLIEGIHFGGKDRLRRFDQDMLDAAVRFQCDPEMHKQIIEAKRRSLQAPRRLKSA